MLQQTLTIARNTFFESIRQPIYVIMVLAVSLMLILNTFLAGYTLEDDNRLLMDMGLSTLFWAGMLMAVFTATGVLSDEIENKTVLTVVSKPVGRPIFVLGKYVGVTGAILLAVYTLSLVFLLTIRHKVMESAADKWDFPCIYLGFLAFFASLIFSAVGNYMYRWSFPSTFALSVVLFETLAYVAILMLKPTDAWPVSFPPFAATFTINWEYQPIWSDFIVPNTEEGVVDPGVVNYSQLGDLYLAIILIWQAVAIITAVAVAASTRTGQVITLVICLVVFVLGMLSEPMFGEFLREFDPAKYEPAVGWTMWSLSKVLYTLVPNLQLLWTSDALINYNHISWAFMGTATAYSFLQITAYTLLAISLFQTREVG